jgi:AcrR family transcriptional regulator
MGERELTRRERYRRQTLDEIKSAAVQQLAEGGAAAVSLNAIARTMAMSAPALYRYFAGRDELLAELAVDFYDALADTLEAAAGGAGSAGDRVRSVASAYRGWALANPHAYRLIFETPSGSGLDLAPDRIVPAAQRSMDVLLAALSAAGSPPPEPIPRALEQQIRAWAQKSHHRDLAVAVLHLGLIWWSRLHGLVSLELGQHLTATGVQPDLLYRAETEALLGRLTAGG